MRRVSEGRSDGFAKLVGILTIGIVFNTPMSKKKERNRACDTHVYIAVSYSHLPYHFPQQVQLTPYLYLANHRVQLIYSQSIKHLDVENFTSAPTILFLSHSRPRDERVLTCA